MTGGGAGAAGNGADLGAVVRGGRAAACQADVTDEAQVRRLIAFTLRQFGRVDILVANAGVAQDQLAAAMKLDQWEEVIQTNLRGTFLCIREALPQMMAQRSGSIVSISSVAAITRLEAW